jgi:hypothetical protein
MNIYYILLLKLLTYSFAEFSALLPDLQTQFPEKNQSVKYSSETFKSTKSLVNHDVDTEKDRYTKYGRKKEANPDPKMAP